MFLLLVILFSVHLTIKVFWGKIQIVILVQLDILNQSHLVLIIHLANQTAFYTHSSPPPPPPPSFSCLPSPHPLPLLLFMPSAEALFPRHSPQHSHSKPHSKSFPHRGPVIMPSEVHSGRRQFAGRLLSGEDPALLPSHFVGMPVPCCPFRLNIILFM